MSLGRGPVTRGAKITTSCPRRRRMRAIATQLRCSPPAGNKLTIPNAMRRTLFPCIDRSFPPAADGAHPEDSPCCSSGKFMLRHRSFFGSCQNFASLNSELFAIDIAVGVLLKATRQCCQRGTMIRLVLFDFDGTLVDSNALKRACMRATVAKLPGGLPALEAARRLGGNRYALLAEVARLLDPAGAPSAIARRGRALAGAYTRCCARAIAAAPERRGARSALAALKARGIRIWLNSATPHSDLLAIVRGRGLLPWLDGVVGRAGFQNGEPAGRPRGRAGRPGPGPHGGRRTRRSRSRARAGHVFRRDHRR